MSTTSRQERIRQEIKLVEGVRDKKLQEKHRIGHVTDKVREPDFRFTVRRVNFRWQRGNKIGGYLLFYFSCYVLNRSI